MPVNYLKEKEKYDKLMQKNAEKEISTVAKDLIEDIIFNKYELHDARILIGVLAELLISKGIITKDELGESIIKAYKEDIKDRKINT